MHTYTQGTCTHTACMHMHVSTSACVCMCVHACTHTHRTHTHTHRTHTRTYTHTHTCIHTHNTSHAAQTCSEAGKRPGFCIWSSTHSCHVSGRNCYCDGYCVIFNDCCEDVQYGKFITDQEVYPYMYPCMIIVYHNFTLHYPSSCSIINYKKQSAVRSRARTAAGKYISVT